MSITATTTTTDPSSAASFQQAKLLLQQARLVRLTRGHEAALGLHQEILRTHPDDRTAATRLAASPQTPVRHDKACCCDLETKKVDALRTLLKESQYDAEEIQKTLLQIPREKWAAAPSVYVKPCAVGEAVAARETMTNNDDDSWRRTPPPPASSSRSNKDEQEEGEEQQRQRRRKSKSSLEYLVKLFLLGLAVPQQVLRDGLCGGDKTVQLLQDLGLAFPCSMDPSLMIGYVHIVPLSMTKSQEPQQPQTTQEQTTRSPKPLWLVTDLHPRVLSTTTVGTQSHGAVMYIGPDSLCLVRHLPTILSAATTTTTTAKNKSKTSSSQPMHILDVCTGSGIQALAALRYLSSSQQPSSSDSSSSSSNNNNKNDARAVCVDVNPRALRFVQFNAALNQMADRVTVVQADLLEQQQQQQQQPSAVTRSSCLLKERFNVVLANPPFVPVPSQQDTILQRYGLFSSGGSDGEQVLAAILKMAPRWLRPTGGGIVGIVSEFMNPPRRQQQERHATPTNTTVLSSSSLLLRRMEQWWTTSSSLSSSSSHASTGILFTNEVPVEAAAYAARRADSSEETRVWEDHLSQLGITHVSPGLLVVRTRGATESSTATRQPPKREGALLHLRHVVVPKTPSGSLWTPSNQEALEFTTNVLQKDLLSS